jgi:hypothetical protein
MTERSNNLKNPARISERHKAIACDTIMVQ